MRADSGNRKKIVELAAYAALLSWSAFATAGEAPGTEPEALPGNELRLFPAAAMDSTAWRINNWKKVQEAALAASMETTPTGAPALQVDFKTAGGGCNVISPTLKPGGAWRGQSYGTVSLWIKGDAGGRRVNFSVTTGPNIGYSWMVPLDNPAWRKVTLPIESAYTKAGDGKDLHAIQYAMFNAEEAASFQVGDIRLERCAQTLPLDVKTTLLLPRIDDANAVVDGHLTEPAWGKALKAELNQRIQNAGEPKEKTEIRLFISGDRLWIGARLSCADIGKLIAKQTQRDMQIWQDDCLEILLDGRLDAKTYAHFVLNSIDAVQDYRYWYSPVADTFEYDHAWNPDWAHKSAVENNTWTMEISIPLAVAEIRADSPFGIQIGRENHGLSEFSALTATSRFPQAENFAVAWIGDAGTALTPNELKADAPGDLRLTAKAPASSDLDLTLVAADPYGKAETQTVRVRADDAGQATIPVKIGTPVEGGYRLVLYGKAGETPLAPLALGFSIHLPPEIQYGDVFPNPKPKKLILRDGRFAFDKATPILVPPNATERTRKTARFLRDELFAQTGLLLPILNQAAEGKAFRLALAPDAAALGIALESKRTELGGEADAKSPLPAEGYVLDIDPNGVAFAGADEPGLYYAVGTFLQVFKTNLLKKHEPALGCASVLDWPDLRHRVLLFSLGNRYRDREPRCDLPALKTWLKDHVAGAKYNLWSPMLDCGFSYDREPKLTAWNSFLSREDYEELVRFAQEHFLEVVPAFQSGGHSGFIVDAHPEFQEPGYSHDQANTLHENYYKVLFSAYDDILAATPGAKYFHIWHDEWWHQPTAEKTDMFQGKARWEIFRDDILKNYEYFKKRGVTMIMWSDMILNGHNGGYPFNISRAADALPRDIIMGNWSSGCYGGAAKELRDKGFTVWNIYNQFRPAPPQDLTMIDGFGAIVYCHFRQTFWYSEDRVLPDYTHAIPRAADYAWNLRHDAQLPLGEWRRRYLNNIYAVSSFPTRCAPALTFKPVDLAPVANAKRQDWFGQPQQAPCLESGNTTIGLVPFTIPSPEKNDIVAGTVEQPEVAVPLGDATLRGLFFLEASYVPDKQRADFKKRSTRYLVGVPLGEIRIEYVDGPSELVPLRAGCNILDVVPACSDARFMPDVRSTHDTRTVGGGLASVYLIEWSNPWPQRPIRRMVWKSYGTEAVPVLFGLTATR